MLCLQSGCEIPDTKIRIRTTRMRGYCITGQRFWATNFRTFIHFFGFIEIIPATSDESPLVHKNRLRAVGTQLLGFNPLSLYPG
jgi:hypothetical protein